MRDFTSPEADARRAALRHRQAQLESSIEQHQRARREWEQRKVMAEQLRRDNAAAAERAMENAREERLTSYLRQALLDGPEQSSSSDQLETRLRTGGNLDD